MAISARVEPIDRDIQFLVDGGLSPKARSAMFAKYAGEVIADAKARNAKVLGKAPPVTIAVDGREGAPLASVKPDGVIFAEFELFNEVLVWIYDQLELHSPFKEGRYQKSHVMFADGVQTEPSVLTKVADEFAFVNTVPYARKIERGASSQAPDGVYQVVATLARRRFGNLAKVTFSYRTVSETGERNPAIIVKLRG